MSRARPNHHTKIPDLQECSELLELFDADFSELVGFAKDCGPVALNALLERLGGEKIHVPTVHNFWRALQRHVRDEDIRARFRGNNYVELAIEHGLTEREVRRIVHREVRTHRPKVQPQPTMKIPASLHAELREIAERQGVTFKQALAIRMKKES